MISAESCCTPSRDGDCPPPPSSKPARAHPVTRKNGALQGALQIEELDLVRIASGTFLMGSDDDIGFPDDDEGPVRPVTLPEFRIGRFAVTNALFSRFTDATGYISEAERFGWSYVFHLLVSRSARKHGEVQRVPGLEWWRAVNGASWKHPEGRGSHVRDRQDHPVVHISHNDALAFCPWAQSETGATVRLPTEAEWERAARGGLEQKRYVWGDELTPDGEHQCNIWQGDFPRINTGEDGFIGTCPVDTYQPNAFGLYNVAGNVWEWCADPWSARGTTAADRRVMRGGSYLCHHSYCNRYRVAARSSNTVDSTTGNCGFRVAAD
jgi:formylglycine-generating enzyme